MLFILALWLADTLIGWILLNGATQNPAKFLISFVLFHTTNKSDYIQSRFRMSNVYILYIFTEHRLFYNIT